jgi:iron complex outermembrane receptor protein
MSKIPVFLIRILIFTVLVLFFGMSENSFAAEQAFNLGPVSVISIYRPFYKNYVLFPETTETSAIDAGSALKDVPGLWEIRKGEIANDINLRGLHRDYINVLVDGIRIYGACPGRMDPPSVSRKPQRNFKHNRNKRTV